MDTNKTIVNLISSLRATLKARDFDMTNLSDSYLEVEIRLAIGAINRCRNFTPTDSKMFDSKPKAEKKAATKKKTTSKSDEHKMPWE